MGIDRLFAGLALGEGLGAIFPDHVRVHILFLFRLIFGYSVSVVQYGTGVDVSAFHPIKIVDILYDPPILHLPDNSLLLDALEHIECVGPGYLVSLIAIDEKL